MRQNSTQRSSHSPGSVAVGSGGPSSGLEIRLFGPMEVRVGANSLPHLRSRKGLWLLALLALRAGRDVDRDWLAGTLWPDCDEAHGRRSLRQSLHDLRLALGPESWRLASDEPRTLRFDLVGASVDALEFDTALERGSPELLEAAVRLYRGPLLEDCSEDWALESRLQKEQACIQALEKLASGAAMLGEHGAAADRLRAALVLDPLREDLQRSLMEVLAAAGNPAAALLAYREYRALLGREMAAEPSEVTTALFRRLRDESRGSAEPNTVETQKGTKARTKDAAAFRQTLPIPITVLIGRDQDVHEVTSRLTQSRLVTLTGTGGVGKTRLAIQVAVNVAGTYSDGAVFVDLAPLENPDHVSDAVRSALGALAGDASQDPVDDLCRLLSTRQTLLILDNCEHLARACSSLAEALLSRCAALKILATSRQVMGVKGETVWRVPSLAIPRTRANKPIALADVRHVSAFMDFAAIRLFAERARAAESTFEMSHKNAVAIATICSRLDGIPLAIELAAARVKAMPVEKIAARLIDRFRVLLGDRRSRPDGPIPRHQTLRASIDWSYDLLTEQERVLLLRLAVFVGGWTLEAAEAVCSADPIQEWEVLELLTGLVEKSLVVYQPYEDRYRLLETIRQYLTDRPHVPGDATDVAVKHVKFFIAFAEDAESQMSGAIQTEWLDRLEVEHDNLRAALQWSLVTSERNPGAKESGVRLAGALWRFWHVRGFYREGRCWFTAALDNSAHYEPSVWLARAYRAAGAMATQLGEFVGARKYFEKCLSVGRAIDDKHSVSSVLNNLGLLEQQQGDLESARAFLQESVELRRDVGDEFGLGCSLHNLARVATEIGDFDTAVKLHEESLSISRKMGDRWGIGHSFTGLGTVLRLQGNHKQAQSMLQESLLIEQEMGDRDGIAVCLHHLGWVAFGLNRYAEARANQLESLRIMHELGARANIPEALEALAAIACAETEESEHAGSMTAGAHACSSSIAHALTTAGYLYGAADALREAVGAAISPAVQQEYARRIGRLREVMGKDAFASAWSKGRAMNLEQAVSFAFKPD